MFDSKCPCTVRNFHMRFFVFVILSYQNACYRMQKKHKIEHDPIFFFYDWRNVQIQCVNVIDIRTDADLKGSKKMKQSPGLIMGSEWPVSVSKDHGFTQASYSGCSWETLLPLCVSIWEDIVLFVWFCSPSEEVTSSLKLQSGYSCLYRWVLCV